MFGQVTFDPGTLQGKAHITAGLKDKTGVLREPEQDLQHAADLQSKAVLQDP